MKNKNILIYGIVLLIAIMQFNFLLSQEIFLPGQEIPETEGIDVSSQGDNL